MADKYIVKEEYGRMILEREKTPGEIAGDVAAGIIITAAMVNVAAKAISSLIPTPEEKYYKANMVMGNLAVSTDKGRVLLFRESSREATSLSINDEMLWGTAFSPDGRYLAIGGLADNSVHLVDVERGIEIHTERLYGTMGDYVYDVAFSPDSKYLYCSAGCLNSFKVYVFDVLHWQIIAKLKIDTGILFALAVSPDGRLLAAAGSKGHILLIDTSTGDVVTKLTGHATPATLGYASGVRQVVFSPDGSLLASAGWDKTARVWDVARHQEVCCLSGHTKSVWSVAFSPDMQQIATGGDDQTVRLWDIGTQQEVRVLAHHDKPVKSVLFADDHVICVSHNNIHTAPIYAPEPDPIYAPEPDPNRPFAASATAQANSARHNSRVSSENTTPVGVMIIAAFSGLLGVMLAMSILLMLVFTVMEGMSTGDMSALIYGSISLFFGAIFSILFIAVGHGLWTRKNWARIVAIIYACISLIGFPIGTVIGGAMLWYLNHHDIKQQFA